MLANLHSEKDHQTLLKAWKIVITDLHEAHQHAVLVLAGRWDNTYELLKNMTHQLEMSDSVLFLGLIENVNALIADSDICVFSSKLEGCPNSVLECMALKKAVVATDIAGVRQALGEEYRDYCLTPIQHHEDMAKKLFWLLQHPQLCEEIGAYNYRRVCRLFSLEGMVTAYLQLIYQAISTRQPTKADYMGR